MTLIEQITSDLKEAMKAGETQKRDTLRMLDAQIKNEEIASGAREDRLDDLGVSSIVKRAVKQRTDARDQYISGGRADLAENEQAEIDILLVYLPEQMSEDAVREHVSAIIGEVNPAGMSDMGRVMGAVMQKVGDAADGSVVKNIVQEELAKL